MVDVSVILTDNSPAAAQVRDAVASWAAAGLVGECLWVTAAQVDGTVRPAAVEATLVGPGEPESGDLLGFLAVRRLDVVRLVVAHVVPRDGVDVGDLVATGRLVGDVLHNALPRGVGGEGGTRLRLLNVIVPASGVSDLTRDALVPGWDANVVVAAEDRPDLERSSVQVRDGDVFVGHAASALASIAALWPGIDEGSADTLELDSTTHAGDVVVVRAMVRSVVRDDATAELADGICTVLLEDPAARNQHLDWARPAQTPDVVVQLALADLVDGSEWMVHEPSAGSSRFVLVRKFWAALKAATLFNLRLFGLGAATLVGMGTRWAERTATNAIIGEGAGQVIQFRPTSTEALIQQAQDMLEAANQHERNLGIRAEASAVRAPSPTTWSTLRRYCFALVDGSPLPGAYQVPDIAGKPQVLAPGDVVPDPLDTFRTRDDHVMRSCDVIAERVHRAELDEELAELESELAEAQAEEAAARADAKARKSKTAKAAKAAKNAKAAEAGTETVDDPVDETPADEAPSEIDRKVAALAAQVAAIELRVVDTTAELQRLDEWVERREQSLVWRLGVSVREGTEAMRGAADASRKSAMADSRLPADGLKRALRRLVVTWVVLGAVVLGWSLALVYVPGFAQPFGISELWTGIVGAVLVGLVVGIFANHVYYQTVLNFEERVNEMVHRRRVTADRYVDAVRESSRLGMLLGRLEEWAEIIGWALHRTCTPAPSSRETLAVDRLGNLPATVAIATPASDELDVSPVVLSRAVQVLSPRGWATDAFDRAIDHYEAHRRPARDGGHLAADLDTLGHSASPFRLLHDYFVEGAAARYCVEDARLRLDRALDDGELELPPRAMTRRGRFGDGRESSDEEFLAAALGPVTPFVLDIWTPTGQTKERQRPTLSIAWLPQDVGRVHVPDGSGLQVRSATGDVAVRVDIGDRCDITDIVHFGGQHVVPVRAETRAVEGVFD
ncbi:hypothetical protein IGS67_00110 [Flavimobilis sp. GY10621]|uniref:Uncharacterized protein n=1 Tax=Flavimobilis rhizosphaerae TaxID=2775421 RepID=A0ABR9DL90_9MICO|nr:hypothetical protein [Flavimobilis rhizosphaerae]MBD9697905.1 hypothetical protein [Flavimobilis rhizosphaerae]